jgi:hypothetical protein
MRLITALLLLACAGAAYAQSGPETVRAKAEIEKLRALVSAGAVPRARLEQAEAALADAEDADLLRKTVYGADLTEAQSDEMLAAATRRLERRQKAYDDAKKLADAGAVSKLSLGTFLEEIEMARKENALAQTRADLVHEIAQMAHDEEAFETKLALAPYEARGIAERFDGDGAFNMIAFARVQTAFEQQFGKALPVSAMGETAVHRAMGFDHRGRVDVPVHPDAPEGAWLRAFLTSNHIPFFAFRQAVPGKATGAHIHIGPASTHLANGGN